MEYRELKLCAAMIVVTSGISCTTDENISTELVSRPVKTFILEVNTARPSVALQGTVHSVRESDLAFEVSGRVSEIAVAEGELVTAQSPLAKLDDRDFRAAVSSARAVRDAARLDYGRYSESEKKGAVTRQELDQARRALDVAEAALIQAEKAKDDTLLVAPFDGRIAKKHIDEFANVLAKQPVFTLHDESSLEVKVYVSEQDMALIPGDSDLSTVTKLLEPVVLVSAFPEVRIEAAATAVSTAADPTTRTYEATFSFKAPDHLNINSGMTAVVEVRKPSRQDISSRVLPLIPITALHSTRADSVSVWILEDGIVKEASVTLGDIHGEMIEVLDGISYGDELIIAGVNTVYSGMPAHRLR